MLKIEVYSDYVCPYCFFAEEELKKAMKQLDEGVAVEWKPFELRPYPTPTLLPEGNYLQDVWQQSVYPMAQELGIEIRLPEVSPQPYTHLAFEGFQLAQERNLGEAYTHRMFTAFFQESRDIGEVGVLAALAAEVGLDQPEFEQALQSRMYRDKHLEALKAAANLHIRAVPTMVIGSQTIRGFLPADNLKQVIMEETKKARAGFKQR